MRAWVEALVTCGALFGAALLACALNGWHAPPPGAIVGLFLGAIGLGAAAARRRYVARSKPFDDHGMLSTYAASARTLVFASFAGMVLATLGSYLVVLVLDEWTSLVLASIVGSAWIGALPLAPVIVHRLAEREVRVGRDGIDFGRTRTWLRDVVHAEARDHAIVVLRRDGVEIVIPCATEAIARDFATLITARAVPVDVPPMLVRAGRSLVAWRAELISPDYRTARLSAEQAERVLLSGSAAFDERIGAALVLASLGARDRLAEAQRAFVDPLMRAALEQVIKDTLDEHE